MATGIHRSGYASMRPVTPNTTNLPLGNAPGARLDVFLTGTLTYASLFTDPALMSPLGNPFVADVNAYFQYYVDPSLGDVDEQYSGAGILAPYTLPAVLDLDPRLITSSSTIASLQGQITAEIAARMAADLAIEQTGMTAYLGGSLSQGVLSASQFSVVDAAFFVCPPFYGGATGKVYASIYTGNAGTSVTAVLHDVTASGDVGNSGAQTATVPTLYNFAVTLISGHVYVLQLLASNASNPVYGLGYVAIAHP